MRINKVNQYGFTHIVMLVLVLTTVTGVGAVSYLKVKSSQDNKKALSQQKASEKALEIAKQKADATKAAEAKKAAEAVKPVEAAPVITPAPVTAPVKTPTPVITKSNATPYTDCNNGYTDVYVSNKNGTTGSYPSTPNWIVDKTYVYGQKINVYCQTPANEFVYDNSDYVKRADLSPTKP